MTISERIFELLREKGFSQKQLSEYSGISTSTISAWNKRNAAPSAEMLSTIADFLDVSIDYLVTGDDNSDRQTSTSGLVRLRLFEEPASAGKGAWVDDNPCTMVRVPETSISSKAEYILRIKGDSMSPQLMDGDKVFVSNRFSVFEGEIGIFAFDDKLLVKRLGDGCLVSINPKYEPILINNDSFKVVGKVLGKVDPNEIEWI